ncbi:anthranilate phosphoribosyltransferase [Salinibaculum rarum]|uniref:anthranilate phosphoribosyltransferase n=1 Tax=Salinibaculum rarum TaxID=3058903 RepID=UPI00265DFD7C|nr:anthranilate phosphoribosyltransferase [Salinibaculum sp. KK48]
MDDASSEFGDWPLQRLLTEVVGSGHKSADDMTRSQAREAAARILAHEPAETTLGAFLLANRWKRNTPEELAAFTDVMREQSVDRAVPDCEPVDCGANYDGKHTSALLGVAAGITAAAAGTPVVTHSGDRVPTQEATAYKHVLDELGVRTDLDPAESADMVDETGFGFYYQPNFNPGVDALYDRRREMGVRTFINTIETLANPADADVHLGSFYHLAFAKRIVDTFGEMESQNVPRVIMFQGLEGYDDIRPGTTVVAEYDGEFTDYEIETGEYEMAFEREDLAVDDVAADSATITEEVLTGERDDHFADAVVLNAAVRLYAGGEVEAIEDGLGLARSAIAEGSTQDRLEQLKEF